MTAARDIANIMAGFNSATDSSSLATVSDRLDTIEALQDSNDTLAGRFNLIYPLGYIYITSDASFDPVTAFGGDWELYGEGKVLVGQDPNDGGNSEFLTVGNTGGAKTHSLNKDEMQHQHITGAFNSTGNDDWFPWLVSKNNESATNNVPADTFPLNYSNVTETLRWVAGEGNRTHYSEITLGTADAKPTATMGLYDSSMVAATAHNNLQPYIVVKMWERTQLAS